MEKGFEKACLKIAQFGLFGESSVQETNLPPLERLVGTMYYLHCYVNVVSEYFFLFV